MARKITPTHVLLNQIELSSSASSVTFSSIPQGYGDLVLYFDGAFSSDNYLFQVRFNGDSSSGVYAETYINGAPASGGTSSTNQHTFGRTNTVTTTASMEIFDYSATDKHKTSLGRLANGTWNTSPQISSFKWGNSSSISSITVLSNGGAFAANTVISLYGVYA